MSFEIHSFGEDKHLSEKKDVSDLTELPQFDDSLDEIDLLPSQDVMLDGFDDLADVITDEDLEADNSLGCPIEGHGGTWDGQRGNSVWKPFKNETPMKNNLLGKKWEDILAIYKIDGIEFFEGEPDFSEISKGEVEIKDFSDNRTKNFAQAYIKLANIRGCTPREVKKWMKENKYTWHECSDQRTMLKVPSLIHGNVSHSGGVSEYKKEHLS